MQPNKYRMTTKAAAKKQAHKRNWSHTNVTAQQRTRVQIAMPNMGGQAGWNVEVASTESLQSHTDAHTYTHAY